MSDDFSTLKQYVETLKYRITVLRDISGENNLLRCRAEEKLAAVERDLEAARKVADAAVGWNMAHMLKMRFIMASSSPDPDPAADAAYRVMVGVVFEAQNAFGDAIAEYRNHIEAAAIMARPVVRDTLDKTDEEWEAICRSNGEVDC